MNVEIIKSKVCLVQRQISFLKRVHARLLKELANVCTHPHEALVESAYQADDHYVNTYRDYRVCRVCGGAEYGPNYKKLIATKAVASMAKKDIEEYINLWFKEEKEKK